MSLPTRDEKPEPGGWRVQRREAFALGGGVLAGCALGLLGRSEAFATTAALRPPGAGDEEAFLAACIRCGQCVQACPYDTLFLTDLAAGVAAGAPTFDPEAVPCHLCDGYDDYRCIGACPTTALRPVEDERDIAIGEAVIDESLCLAFNGTICRSCWHACPFLNEAIRLDERLRPEVDPEHCIGCGLCVLACPTDPVSIIVEPPARRGDA